MPLALRNLTGQDICVLHQFNIHCGKYCHVVHRCCQRTSPFHVTWLALRVQEKINSVGDFGRRTKLGNILDFLMAKRDSLYRKFVIMQSCGVQAPFTYEISTAPDYEGICSLVVSRPRSLMKSPLHPTMKAYVVSWCPGPVHL